MFTGQGTWSAFHIGRGRPGAGRLHAARLSHVEAACLALVGVVVREALVERAGFGTPPLYVTARLT